MTPRSDNLARTPLFGTIALLAAGLTLLVATGPAIAAERAGIDTQASFPTPPTHARHSNAC